MDPGQLQSLLQPEQKLILLYREGGQWQTSSSGSDWDFSNGSARLVLIQEVDRERQPAIVMDAHQDERFLTCPLAPFRSALCCPILDGGSLLGLLLVEDRKSARAFNFEQLQSWASRSAQLAPSLKPEPTPPLDLRKPLALSGLALLLLAIPFWFGGPKEKPQQRQAQVNTLSRQEMPAATVAESYLAGLRSGNLNGAYRLLTSASQKSLSEALFIERTRGWLAASDRAWGLKFRQIKVIRAGPTLCQVQVVPQGQASKQELWTWDLVREESGWRLKNAPGAGES
ncbi:MAG: GAF domain-containing protein [Candidatus Eremiobacteraeota bacterium]|nr:GAF domain-containing protein [Candidatus Eremiobacteraeota bacterium]